LEERLRAFGEAHCDWQQSCMGDLRDVPDLGEESGV
jgi:hypothetical protein